MPLPSEGIDAIIHLASRQKGVIRILRTLKTTGKGCRSEIAVATHLSPRTVSRRLRELEVAGIVEGDHAKTFPSIKQYWLSERGDKVLQKINSQFGRTVESNNEIH